MFTNTLLFLVNMHCNRSHKESNTTLQNITLQDGFITITVKLNLNKSYMTY